MTRNFRFTSVLLTALVAVVSLTAQTAQAQVTKPFKINGRGIAPDGFSLNGFSHVFEGNATYLGRHCGNGQVKINTIDGNNPFPFNPDGSITGTFESARPCYFYAANGDILACEYGKGTSGLGSPGRYTLAPTGQPGVYVATFVAKFVPTVGSTGRFAGATGGWVMYAKSTPFVLGSTDDAPYSWHGEGNLTFKK